MADASTFTADPLLFRSGRARVDFEIYHEFQWKFVLISAAPSEKRSSKKSFAGTPISVSYQFSSFLFEVLDINVYKLTNS